MTDTKKENWKKIVEDNNLNVSNLRKEICDKKDEAEIYDTDARMFFTNSSLYYAADVPLEELCPLIAAKSEDALIPGFYSWILFTDKDFSAPQLYFAYHINSIPSLQYQNMMVQLCRLSYDDEETTAKQKPFYVHYFGNADITGDEIKFSIYDTKFKEGSNGPEMKDLQVNKTIENIFHSVFHPNLKVKRNQLLYVPLQNLKPILGSGAKIYVKKEHDTSLLNEHFQMKAFHNMISRCTHNDDDFHNCLLNHGFSLLKDTADLKKPLQWLTVLNRIFRDVGLRFSYNQSRGSYLVQNCETKFGLEIVIELPSRKIHLKFLSACKGVNGTKILRLLQDFARKIKSPLIYLQDAQYIPLNLPNVKEQNLTLPYACMLNIAVFNQSWYNRMGFFSTGFKEEQEYNNLARVKPFNEVIKDAAFLSRWDKTFDGDNKLSSDLLLKDVMTELYYGYLKADAELKKPKKDLTLKQFECVKDLFKILRRYFKYASDMLLYKLNSDDYPSDAHNLIVDNLSLEYDEIIDLYKDEKLSLSSSYLTEFRKFKAFCRRERYEFQSSKIDKGLYVHFEKAWKIQKLQEKDMDLYFQICEEYRKYQKKHQKQIFPEISVKEDISQLLADFERIDFENYDDLKPFIKLDFLSEAYSKYCDKVGGNKMDGGRRKGGKGKTSTKRSCKSRKKKTMMMRMIEKF